mmetsp:Transcript_28946/g.72733  ORF Transcript_28946/g.72733 Transcript_28946/m.72733 type:complete len:94 (+) Transcript_28946:1094-1375(+)
MKCFENPKIFFSGYPIRRHSVSIGAAVAGGVTFLPSGIPGVVQGSVSFAIVAYVIDFLITREEKKEGNLQQLASSKWDTGLRVDSRRHKLAVT